MIILVKNLQVISSSPLPVGTPAGQGQQAVAMVMGGRTGLISPPAGRIHLQETEAPDDGAHLSPSDCSHPSPNQGSAPRTGTRTDLSGKPAEESFLLIYLQQLLDLLEVSNLALLTIFPSLHSFKLLPSSSSRSPAGPRARMEAAKMLKHNA